MQIELLEKGRVKIDNANIGFRNFEGAEGKYNKQGDRNFAAFLDDESAQFLSNAGWNVKLPNSDEESEYERNPFLPVSISYKFYPPKIVLISGNNKAVLEEHELDKLDWIEFERVDLIVRPYTWTVRGNTGIKAYVYSMYITMVVDEYTEKYGI